MNEWLDDLKTAVAFLTRVPMPHPSGPMPENFVRAHRMFPVVGAAIGGAVGLVCLALRVIGVPDLAAAALALGAGAILTGALHEDGLADVADGFGGGRDRDAKLEIMRDSRLGTYGACALVMSLLLRWSALASLADARTAALALVAAHAAARAPLPGFMALVPPARSDGLAAAAGPPPHGAVAAAGLLGALALGLCLGPMAAVVALILLAAAAVAVARVTAKAIGGHTGDVLGALEQVNEILVLLVAATLARPGA